MKIFALLLSLVTFSATAGEIHVKVSGMVCSMCAQGIQKNFSKIDAVESLNVDLDNKFVKINTKAGEELSDKEISEVITKAGYNVAGIERK